MSESPCPNCGTPRPTEASFCPGCGAPKAGATAAGQTAKGSKGPQPTDLSHQLALALGDTYEVRGVVGRGGFAEVYEIFDRGLSRRLAVKVLRPDVAWTPGMLDRFKEECRVLASLSHPNILPIHFVGEGQGLVYYVMPYVEGQSLGEYLRAFGALDTARAVELALPVLEALGHAHSAGLLHRDIKPENVLIDGTNGRPLLVDFGIAKRLDQAAGLTQTGFVVGTPQYMSPEQALGQGQIDARSDIYSFGALLFQMVTGAPPYDGDSSQEIVGKHIAAPVPQPTDRDARIPVWLSDVIVRCLSKRPYDRFQSVAQMIDAIRTGQARPAGATVSAEQVATRVSGAAETIRSLPSKPGPELDGSPAPAPPKLRTGLIAGGFIILIGTFAGWFLFGRPIVVEVTNRFDTVLTIETPSGDTLVIPGGGTGSVNVPSAGFARMAWTAAARRSPEGQALGEAPSGEVTIQVGRGGGGRSIGLTDARVPMFEPLITNAGSRPIRLLVNAGSASARDCGCLVQPGEVRAPIGYYPLYQDSRVRAIDPDGRTATFTDLGPQVDRARSRVGLRFEDKDFR